MVPGFTYKDGDRGQFTFHAMSYVIDVYRGDLRPHARYGEYLLFVCFFPHLVAGPIVRPKSFLPQLAAEPVFDEYQQGEGVAPYLS